LWATRPQVHRAIQNLRYLYKKYKEMKHFSCFKKVLIRLTVQFE
jgi:hypothetical protein